MKLTISFDPETNLINLESSGGTLALTQTEASALYVVLGRALGWKGKVKLFLKRRMFTEI